MLTTDPSAPALEIRGLTKRFGAHTAVDDLSFASHPGTVTGFLGPNGAGKSTTLRMLTGLARPDVGVALVGGRPYRELEHPGRIIGVMLDATTLHRGRTGLATLRLTARTLGMPLARAEEMLETVGLTAAARTRVGAYSYGMRQRLGLAVALMGDPAILVLDEPANGLDPEGIRWMRRLLRDFADAGGTVLLSSHQLREVEATVDRLVVISRGRLVREGTLAELRPDHATRVGAEIPAALTAALDRHGIAWAPRPDGLLDVGLPPIDLGRLAVRERIVLTALTAAESEGLEELFFQLTEEPADSSTTAPSTPAPAPALAS
ncbi:ABC transporter ATP-binding protein [Brachybacterium squillarum]|uniref:ABC transporter ATP-binding protein n=1 Tax=Brachybacterium squillarum TaxID=661979 RepID=UPI000262939D|nr:ATP-binding cassette domain-containing protein [Brachybacterium squillarum]